MTGTARGLKAAAVVAVLGTCFALAGCMHAPPCVPTACDGQMARELKKVSLPPYVIEPPDILLVDTLRVVPLPPYRIEPLDAVILQVTGTKPNEPIAGPYVVEPEGTVNLGFTYGSVRVSGLTLEEAQKSMESHLRKILNAPVVSIALGQSRAMQQIRGEHLVRQDGTIGLGVYGGVYVAGMTLTEAKAAVEEHLSQFLFKPEVSVDVAAFNSKVYYVITDGGGFGKQVYRFPITGNETVLEAISQINGLPAVAAKNCVWVARPAPDETCEKQVLPVDIVAITEDGSTATNYQILPGDRIFVKADRWIALDNALVKVLTPVERVFGALLLGSITVQTVEGKTTGFGGFGAVGQ